MTNEEVKPTRIDRRLVGEPRPLGNRTLRPVARVSGWSGVSQAGAGHGFGAWLRVQPVELIVQEADGSEGRVLTNAEHGPLPWLFGAGLLVAGVCSILIIIGKLSVSAPKRWDKGHGQETGPSTLARQQLSRR